MEALSSPVFNRTIPESSGPRLKQMKVRLRFIRASVVEQLSQQQVQASILAFFGVFIYGGSSI